MQVTKIFELDAHVERLATTAALMWPGQGTFNKRGKGRGKRQRGFIMQKDSIFCLGWERKNLPCEFL